MGASEKAVAAVMALPTMMCKRESGGPHGQPCCGRHQYVNGRWPTWTDRGCEVAVAAADLAVDTDRPNIQAQALRGVSDFLDEDDRLGWDRDVWVFPDTETMRPRVRLIDWLRARADRIETQP